MEVFIEFVLRYLVFVLQVKVLFVRNLDLMTSEDRLRQIFGDHGTIERVKKQTDYAFVHFRERKDAEMALAATNSKIQLFPTHLVPSNLNY